MVHLFSKRYKRWLYRGGHPNFLARAINRFYATVHSLGVAPNSWVTLEVAGRRSGRMISFPLAMVVIDGKRYLVAMLGKEASWVRNVRAADGYALLRHGRSEHVRLVEVPVEQRPPILKAYLQIAPGARPHIPVDQAAPLEAFNPIADQFPVFNVIDTGNSESGE